MKVSKLLTLESSFILAFDQLRLEEEVLVEPFAFPQGSWVSLLLEYGRPSEKDSLLHFAKP